MTPGRKWKIVRFCLTIVYLMGGWVLFAGMRVLSTLALGFLLSLVVSFLTYSLFIEENEVDSRSLLPRVHWFVLYLGLLIYKMYVATFKVVWLIIKGGMNPRVVHFRTRLKSDIARVTLSNSITMTPGTITLTLDDDHLVVHWLDAKTSHSKYAGDLIKGSFENILKRIWI